MVKRKRIICYIASALAALMLTCATAFASQAAVDSNFEKYTYPDTYANCLLIDGVDVSAWQGDDIDWAKVKREGMDYVFIRIGYTGLDTGSLNKDKYFETNYQGAKEAGLLVGVYYYSCATTIKEAQNEAKYVLKLLNGRDLDLPVVFDFEYDGRIKTKYKNKATTTSNILAFLNYIETKSSYDSMFYSYRNITDPGWSPKFNVELIDAKYPVWMAQYSTDIGYARPMSFWQYTSSGKVRGIDGKVDCNFWFYDNNAEETKAGTYSIKDAVVKLNDNVTTFSRYEKKPKATVTYNGTTLTEGVHYKKFYLKNVNAGTAYVMIRGIGSYSNTQLVPFIINKTNIANGGTVAAIEPQKYTGNPVTVATTVAYKGTTLKSGIDYTVSYSNNTTPGKATVTIVGKRNFNGSFSTTFDIVKMQKKPAFTGTTAISKEYTSGPFSLGMTFNSSGAVTYTSNNPAVATISENGTVTLTGALGTAVLTMKVAETPEHYAATRNITLTVTKQLNAISGVNRSYTVLTNAKPFQLAPSHRGPAPITYASSNPAVATIDANGLVTVKGPGKTNLTIVAAEDANFMAASKVVSLQVNRTKAEVIDCIRSSTVKVSSKAGYGYIKLNWKRTGEESIDYYEIFRSKKKSSFGKTRLGRTKSGKILTAKNTKSLVKNTRYYYKVRGVKVIDGKKYYTKWSNITNQKYTYTSTANIKIIKGVKATKVSAASSRGTGYIKIAWKKKSNYKVHYYQVYRSTTKTFKSGTIKTYKTSSGKKLYLKNTSNLKKGKRYYYKVRGVRVVDGKKYYTKWSNVVTRIAK